MTESFYHKHTIIGRLFAYISDYFKNFTRPTAHALSFMIIAIIATQGLRSIRSLFFQFLRKVNSRSLNAYYYACQAAHASITDFANATISKTLPLINDSISSLPLILLIDDTLTPKFGKHFLVDVLKDREGSATSPCKWCSRKGIHTFIVLSSED